jgi:hypothetical protein
MLHHVFTLRHDWLFLVLTLHHVFEGWHSNFANVPTEWIFFIFILLHYINLHMTAPILISCPNTQRSGASLAVAIIKRWYTLLEWCTMLNKNVEI